MADNIIEFERAAYVWSQLHGRTAAGILFGFAQAFPSLAHARMWAVIARWGVCDSLLHLLHSLCTDLTTSTFYDNTEVYNIYIEAGITHGCPFSGTMLAISADPLVQAHLANITRFSMRTCLFADDVASVLRCMRTQLGPLLEQLQAGRRASGLTLS